MLTFGLERSAFGFFDGIGIVASTSGSSTSGFSFGANLGSSGWFFGAPLVFGFSFFGVGLFTGADAGLLASGIVASVSGSSSPGNLFGPGFALGFGFFFAGSIFL